MASVGRELWYHSSGASDWAWSTFTNDNNGYQVMVEIEAAGDHSFVLAARGDWHLIDRIVIHEESLEDAVVTDPAVLETSCR